MFMPSKSAQPTEMQTRAFEPAPHLEESGYGNQHCGGSSHSVVDPAFAKQSAYNSKLELDSLVITTIPQGSAIQRAGREGKPDECYRLYTDSGTRLRESP